jgi:hypothetical protein
MRLKQVIKIRAFPKFIKLPITCIQIVTAKSSSGNFYGGDSEPGLFLTYTPKLKNPSPTTRGMIRLFFW